MPNPNDPLPDFSDVQSGSSSAPLKDVEVPLETYTVEKGDTLSKIAKHRYGDAAKWKAVFEANRDQIKNPDLIYPGQVLKLPQL